MGFISAAMGVLSLVGASKEAKAAKAAAKGQASADLRVTQERVFQSKQEERQLAGQTRAIAAGSGVKADVGAPVTILAEQAKTFARERKFMQETGQDKARQTIMRGKMQGEISMVRGIQSAMGSFASAASTTKRAGGAGFFSFAG